MYRSCQYVHRAHSTTIHHSKPWWPCIMSISRIKDHCVVKNISIRLLYLSSLLLTFVETLHAEPCRYGYKWKVLTILPWLLQSQKKRGGHSNLNFDLLGHGGGIFERLLQADKILFWRLLHHQIHKVFVIHSEMSAANQKNPKENK